MWIISSWLPPHLECVATLPLRNKIQNASDLDSIYNCWHISVSYTENQLYAKIYICCLTERYLKQHVYVSVTTEKKIHYSEQIQVTHTTELWWVSYTYPKQATVHSVDPDIKVNGEYCPEYFCSVPLTAVSHPWCVWKYFRLHLIQW